MAVTKIFEVNYEIVNVASLGSASGFKYKYRKGVQSAKVVAASAAGVGAVLAGDVSTGSGESIEILDIHEVTNGAGCLT